MIRIRHAKERGHAQSDWLNSYHSFSFGEYHDPRFMGFSNLRVINDDTVAPGKGFGTHGHSDMEIVTYVLDGSLEHKDSLGTGSIIRPGDVQRMSAGIGVTHSEFNPSTDQAVHFLQIWLEPNRSGVEPGYAQKYFPPDERRGRLALLVSPDGRDGSLSAHQDGFLYGALLEGGEAIEHDLDAGRRAYLHVARGRATLNGEPLAAGDGAAIEGIDRVRIEGVAGAELLLFDLA